MNEISRVCAVIVTFNPEIDRLTDNITSIFGQVDKLIIVDNASTNIKPILDLSSTFDIEVLQQVDNTGISGALNRAIDFVDSNDYEYLLTLDQDSIATENMVKELVNCMVTSTKIAMVGPKIHDLNMNSKEDEIFEDEIDEVMLLITSGALCRIANLKKVGCFDDDLFIDCVDFDMSLKLIEAGYRVCRVNSAKLIHEIGAKEQKNLFGKHFYILNHSSFRVYYMVRNRVYLMLRYRGLAGYKVRADFLHLITRTLGMLVFEADRVGKLKATVKGLIVGLKLYFNRS
jgi:rhamnosyltransferase